MSYATPIINVDNTCTKFSGSPEVVKSEKKCFLMFQSSLFSVNKGRVENCFPDTAAITQYQCQRNLTLRVLETTKQIDSRRWNQG